MKANQIDSKNISPEVVYNDLKNKYGLEYTGLSKKISRVSALRIFLFLAGIAGIYAAAGVSAGLVTAVALVFCCSFVLVVIWHNQLHKQKEETGRLLKINELEMKALNGDFSLFDGAHEFFDAEHPFAGDLDVFGEGSIFQYINRSATIIGKNLLANWFLHPEMQTGIIKSRQKAADDLASKNDWRQKFRSVGLSISESKDDRGEILSWLQRPAKFKKTIFSILLLTIPILSVLMLTLLILGIIPYQLFIIYFIGSLAISYSQASRIGAEHELLNRKSEIFLKFSRLLGLISAESFSSEKMKNLQLNLEDKLKSGSALKKLSAILNAFDSRLNIFGWLILNYFMLWDILQARRLEKWREAYRDMVPGWFETIGEVDALCSLACLRFNRPGFAFPQPVEGGFNLVAEQCGHPLINEKVRVDNPVDFKDWGQFIIVTGANMAGKSTYLRSVAVNFILAMTGAPVCAKNFVFTPSGIFTSIRTRDDLLHNESYFFAELKRLKAIITSLEEGKQLFIILDEILKGTNSKDKQTGSKALLKQLVRFGASGLIATHDLSLGELILEYPENIRNQRFEVEIQNDELLFDYKLKDGISQNLNATFLMKKMGITV